MIAQVRGTLLEKGYDHVVVDVGGVGLRVTVSLSTLAALRETGQEARLLTYLQVREDALTLFGFATAEERLAFEQCISVQQVGPKLAMSILSTLSPSELASAIRAEDVARLRKIPGVGNKTAERLVLELRDKMDKRVVPLKPAGSPAPNSTSAQVASALQNLGYKPAEAERAAESAAAGAGTSVSVADLVKKALRALAE